MSESHVYISDTVGEDLLRQHRFVAMQRSRMALIGALAAAVLVGGPRLTSGLGASEASAAPASSVATAVSQEQDSAAPDTQSLSEYVRSLVLEIEASAAASAGG
ncbi:MAG: hypothetical protein ACKVHU_02450 [Acidimicrobiales bacterium]